MINFRYHIVSLMAVFLALSVGIVLGVTLRGPVNEGLVTQAAQDRKTVQDLRAEMDRKNALDEYRDAYAQQVGQQVAQNVLSGRSVALVVMPGAPGAVVGNLSKAVAAAGGTLTHTVKLSSDAFDPTKTGVVVMALQPYRSTLGLTDNVSGATALGLALGRGIFARPTQPRDGDAAGIDKALTAANLVTIGGSSTAPAELAIVVTAQATDPAPDNEVLQAHVQMDVALKSYATGVVLAGPDSDNLDGTDVGTARNQVDASALSTVDVADLSSGVTTTILAAKEQWLGRQGNYGALARAGAPLPELPVR